MTKAEQEWSLIEALVYCKGKRLTKKSCAGCPYAGVGCAIDATIAKLKTQEQEIEDLKQEIEGHKDNLRETLDEMMRYADELKAQEPVKPIMRHVVFEYDTSSGWENKMYCPKCKMELLTRVNYCPKCGQAVKWE